MADSPADEPGVRLNRFLASCGLGSRRKCEALITEGRIEINGRVVTEFATRVEPSDHVKVDGRAIQSARETTILLNKPVDYLCTKNDPEGRKTIYDLLPRKFQQLNYVGRLDRESQGLILLTNSGDLNQHLTHPRHQAEKEYIVKLNRPFSPDFVPKLIEGIRLSDGLAKAEAATVLSSRRLSIVLTQGINRQIRRMFAKLGFKVRELERVRIGELTAPDLSTGDFRILGRRDIDRACHQSARKPGKPGPDPKS